MALAVTEPTGERRPRVSPRGTRLPSVAEVVSLDQVRVGEPIVLGGAEGLDRPVRWVHVSEVSWIGTMLAGGELILSTGIAWPEHPADLVTYLNDLVAAGASGLVVELVRRFSRLPRELIAAADKARFPLVGLRRETAFVAITEAAHSLILDTQLARMRHSDEIRRTFQAMATEAPSPIEVVERMAQLAGCPVVLENLAHHVMAAAGAGTDDVLTDWESRSRHAALSGGGPGWLATRVGARGQTWGWVILLPGTPPDATQRAVADHGANALAVVQLIGSAGQPLEHQAHQRVLSDIIGHRYATAREGHVRAQGLGVTTAGRVLCAMVIRGTALSAPVISAVMESVRVAGACGLVGMVGDCVGVLLATEGDNRGALLDRVARVVRDRLAERPGDLDIGVGDAVEGLEEVHRAFAEADDAATAGRPSGPRAYATVADIGLRGLLHLLRGDSHLQRFVERQLGPILDSDERHGTHYVEILVSYLEAGGNKSVAAERARLSRATFYKQLDHIARLFGRDLDDAEERTALYVALLVVQDLRRTSSRSGAQDPSGRSTPRWLTRNGLPSGSTSTA